MTYIATDRSVQDGDPVFLFHFVQGSSEWRYTAAAFEVTALAETWAPAPIDTSNFTQSNEMAKDTLSLELPRTNELAETFLGYAPSNATSVTVYRGHAGDGEFVVYWKGRVASAGIERDQVSLECEPIFTSMRRPGLRARYQKSCRHALYGRGCQLNEDDYEITGTVTAVNGVSVTVTIDASEVENGYFTGGMIRNADGLQCLITGHSGSSLTLIRPFAALIEEFSASSGEVPVSLYPGCDHTRTTCLEKFDNLDNFGGFPWIPGKNPFGGSSIV